MQLLRGTCDGHREDDTDEGYISTDNGAHVDIGASLTRWAVRRKELSRRPHHYRLCAHILFGLHLPNHDVVGLTEHCRTEGSVQTTRSAMQ